MKLIKTNEGSSIIQIHNMKLSTTFLYNWNALYINHGHFPGYRKWKCVLSLKCIVDVIFSLRLVSHLYSEFITEV